MVPGFPDDGPQASDRRECAEKPGTECSVVIGNYLVALTDRGSS